METRNRPTQPEQPPKEAAYRQASNPVSQTPQEQRAPARQYGDPPAPITRRGADSKPSNDAARARLDEQRNQDSRNLREASNVDLKYGVEQQPAEGYIADSVERKGMGIQRAQAGAHAGPVGSAAVPGHPGFGEQRDLAARMDEKRAQHDRLLGDRIGHSPPEPNYDVAEREAVREQKLKQNENLNVGEAVKQTTGDPVV
ncbi:hypothetical protein N7492_001489 [Penicillium capsulatum]|uniref:Uncharacterized protein n=1 Tax=Penicillium capsulatum TaxID=69766 RepID=A0A9W9ITC8_9EURO|nr:hypothetical protein N7492_001489 [Penicillium capsulatum]KAJ6129457.1 hypothetical protein N7512_002237 [Penicillium capsulatum]